MMAALEKFLAKRAARDAKKLIAEPIIKKPEDDEEKKKS